MKGHSDIIADISFSPDGNKIVTLSYDCSIKIWFFYKPTIPILLFDITKSRSLMLNDSIIENCQNLSTSNEKVFYQRNCAPNNS